MLKEVSTEIEDDSIDEEKLNIMKIDYVQFQKLLKKFISEK